MQLTESTPQYYQETRSAPEKWSWARSVWFILLGSGLFWGVVICLLWSAI
jgi:hypothetical protein